VLETLKENFTLVGLAGERPSDVEIEKTNTAELNEIMVINEEGATYNPHELEFLTQNKDWIENNSLRLTPGSAPGKLYILPETNFQSIVVEFYSVVDNIYRTERKTIE